MYLLLQLAIRASLSLELTVRAARVSLHGLHVRYWLSKNNPKLATWELARMRAIKDGTEAEDASYWRARTDMLEPGDPIPDVPPHLLERQL
jgi:hypothetical protein